MRSPPADTDIVATHRRHDPCPRRRHRRCGASPARPRRRHRAGRLADGRLPWLPIGAETSSHALTARRPSLRSLAPGRPLPETRRSAVTEHLAQTAPSAGLAGARRPGRAGTAQRSRTTKGTPFRATRNPVSHPVRFPRFALAIMLCADLAACSGSHGGPATASGDTPTGGSVLDRPVPGRIASLPLVDQNGRRVTLASLQGKAVVLVDFLTLSGDLPAHERRHGPARQELETVGAEQRS